MADGSAEAAPAATPKKKTHKKKAHKGHKFHADHKVAKVEEPPPPPAPTPEPPPPPAPIPEPAPVAVAVEKEEDDSGFYIGGGAGSFRVDVIGQAVTGAAGANIGMVGREFGAYGNVGYNFSDNIAVEFRVGGVQEEQQVREGAIILGAPASVPFVFTADTDAFYSGFLKGTLPIGESFGIYGLVGGTHAVVDLAANIGPLVYRDDFNDGDFSYGGGIEGTVGKSLVLGAEWVKYIDDNDGGVALDLSGVVGRVQWKF